MDRRNIARFSIEPSDPARFTRKHDRYYTAFAGLYDAAVRRLPVWKTWLAHALPHIEGPRVLEVSFGTGYLLARYADRVEAHGVDLNRAMVETARGNLLRAACSASLVQAKVEALPYADRTFDSVLDTMAFSGYPDGARALSEMKRVLRPGGKVIFIDWVNCGLCVDERGVGEWKPGPRRGGPPDFLRFIEESDNTLVVPTGD